MYNKLDRANGKKRRGKKRNLKTAISVDYLVKLIRQSYSGKSGFFFFAPGICNESGGPVTRACITQA